MNAYGYTNENENLLQLSQITIQANPDHLRLLAEFLKKCASQMDDDENWEHAHLVDEHAMLAKNFDLIIYKE